jgi:hypothetical protein
MTSFERIFARVKELPVIDTHEHFAGRESDRNREADVLNEYLEHYFSCDLVSAGLSQEQLTYARDVSKPLMQRWDVVKPFWQASRYTGYGRSLDIAARDLYGIPGISGDTIEELNRAFRKALQPGWYQHVLKEKSGIEVSLLDSNLDCDRTYFRSVYRLDRFVYPQDTTVFDDVEKETGITVHTLQDWMDACEKSLENAFAKGAVALKSGLAYERSLNYEEADVNVAEKEFGAVRSSKTKEELLQNVIQRKAFQDFMMHHVMKLANERELVFQIHTGHQEGNANTIRNSDPSLLNNLFLKYPGITFDIFHIGYPFQNILSSLAKMFPHVYIDMCWAHIISPQACIDALVEWLDAVPYNKISAFGGDYAFVDGVYGHQYIARENVSKSLARKVDESIFDEDTAVHIAEMLFYTNPKNIFRL